MFKSIFMKYISAFMIIILVSILLSVTIITTVLGLYDGNTKNRALENVSVGVASFIGNDYRSSQSEDFKTYILGRRFELESIITLMSVNAENVLTFLADGTGELILAAGLDYSGDYTAETGLVKEGMYLSEKIKEDKKISTGRIYTDTVDGLFSEKHRSYIISINGEDGSVIGYAVSCLMKSDMDALITSMIRTIVVSFLFLMLASLIAVYFITEKLVSPMREMSYAAKEFASGHFDVRVSVRGNDEMAELADAFNNMAANLQRSEETRRLFLANVSHDLRTPMTTITGFIDSILSGLIPEEQVPHYLGIISSEVKRLSRLVKSLLDITKIQAGERQFTMEVFDICEMARQIIISSEQRLEEKKLDVEFNADYDNMYVNADKDAIYQVLYNLCDNGIKFSKEGGKYIVGINGDESTVKVSVYNEGEGISPEDIQFIFDRFYKSDKSRGLDKSGYGLGLYISRTIIEAHKQNITAESEYGSWCRFTFTLQKAENPKKQRGDKKE